MLTVDMYAGIRLAHRDGLGIRALARKFRCSRQSVRKALMHAEPPPFQHADARASPKLDAFKAIIDQILLEDTKAPRKQRHYSTQIFERLVAEHGYAGSYHTVRRYVRLQRQSARETFIPLTHQPGSRVECDFGHVWVDFPEGRRQVAVLLVTWSYSHFPFAIALPSEKTEAILSGMVEALSFFACVPREVWWDNPTTVATAVLRGRQRRLHPRYQALASHYNFEPLFCMPARGNEKSHVENRVKRLQRRWATPVPRFRDLVEMSTDLRRRCEAERDRTVQRVEGSIGARFEEERAAALGLPEHPFDPCVLKPALVDKYQTVRYETNWYSVPRSLAFATVLLKGYVDRIDVVHRERIVASHPRCYDRHAQVLDPLHYLVTLGHKPATLDHSAVYRDWQLPACFTRLRERLEEQHGAHAAARQYVRVLQLFALHPARRVSEAIELCLAQGYPEARRITQAAERLAQASTALLRPDDTSDPGPLGAEQKRQPISLRHFDQLLSKGESTDDRSRTGTAEGEPQAVAPTDHAR